MSKLSDKKREKLPESTFAFPKERKEPLEDARHVQEAVARFDQVKDVTNKERDEAWKRIQKAAKKFGVELQEKDWRELFTPDTKGLANESHPYRSFHLHAFQIRVKVLAHLHLPGAGDAHDIGFGRLQHLGYGWLIRCQLQALQLCTHRDIGLTFVATHGGGDFY